MTSSAKRSALRAKNSLFPHVWMKSAHKLVVCLRKASIRGADTVSTFTSIRAEMMISLRLKSEEYRAIWNEKPDFEFSVQTNGCLRLVQRKFTETF